MKTAVVLFNLGGPDSLKAVKPFLKNLFRDPAIISLPPLLRGLVGGFIAARRAGKAKNIYKQIGGRSPILEQTQAQASALEAMLQQRGEYRVFIAMRYWHPMTAETVTEVKNWQPSRIILLPLYPHFSTTTTRSSFNAWYEEAQKQGLKVPHHPICCYPFDNHFVTSVQARLKPVYDEAVAHGRPRILFSAHGLPEKIISGGDPYQWQIERSVSAIMRGREDLDHVVCYQSRVGPLKWLGPSSEEEIERAGRENVPVVIVPISFVSEHSETLVELDIEYRALARKHGVPFYGRVQTPGTHPEFIESLAWLCDSTNFYPGCSNALGRQCPAEFSQCGYKEWKT